MKDSKYLYDRDSLRGLSRMSYKEALETKISLANQLIKNLLKEDYLTRDSVRINDCIRAIKFNERLIKEMEE